MSPPEWRQKWGRLFLGSRQMSHLKRHLLHLFYSPHTFSKIFNIFWFHFRHLFRLIGSVKPTWKIHDATVIINASIHDPCYQKGHKGPSSSTLDYRLHTEVDFYSGTGRKLSAFFLFRFLSKRGGLRAVFFWGSGSGLLLIEQRHWTLIRGVSRKMWLVFIYVLGYFVFIPPIMVSNRIFSPTQFSNLSSETRRGEPHAEEIWVDYLVPDLKSDQAEVFSTTII